MKNSQLKDMLRPGSRLKAGMTALIFPFFLIIGAVSSSQARPKLIPVVNGLFSTGQWYFEGEKSSLGGNANLTFVPALRFSNRFSLIPTLESSYRGTRSAEELAGGNTLFQDTWENAVNVKGVYRLTRKVKLRARTGARMKWFRETRDETWDKGLYDYRIFNVGTEAEWAPKKNFSLALGYDYSFLLFPNYNSLESGQTGDQAREFAGDDVLDANSQLASFRAGFPLMFDVQSSLQVFYSPRDYTDQTVVLLSGLLSQTKRRDVYTGGSLSFERLFRVTRKSILISNISYGYSGVQSNQNHYDAQQTTFVADFYDYDQQRAALNLSLGFGATKAGPMTVDAGAAYSRRDYRSRVIQNAAGQYQSEKLYVIDKTLTLGFSYPLAKYFRLRTNATFGRTKSNNNYEELYRYNYNNANYQFGFSYEY